MLFSKVLGHLTWVLGHVRAGVLPKTTEHAVHRVLLVLVIYTKGILMCCNNMTAKGAHMGEGNLFFGLIVVLGDISVDVVDKVLLAAATAGLVVQQVATVLQASAASSRAQVNQTLLTH